jgi:site-specific DNA recombinase
MCGNGDTTGSAVLWPGLARLFLFMTTPRLIDAYQAGVIELAELAERRQRIAEQGYMLRERAREIEQQRADRTAELRLLEGVDAFCASVRGAMEEPSFEVQQKVLQLVVDRIVVEDTRVVIEHIVPSGPVRLQPEHLVPATLMVRMRRFNDNLKS